MEQPVLATVQCNTPNNDEEKCLATVTSPNPPPPPLHPPPPPPPSLHPPPHHPPSLVSSSVPHSFNPPSVNSPVPTTVTTSMLRVLGNMHLLIYEQPGRNGIIPANHRV